MRYTTGFVKFYADERSELFSTKVNFTHFEPMNNGIFPKISTDTHLSVIKKLLKFKGSLYQNEGQHTVLFQSTPINWIRSHIAHPYFYSEREGEKITDSIKYLAYKSESEQKIAHCVLASSVFFIWYITTSDCYNLTQQPIKSFPLDPSKVKTPEKYDVLSTNLEADMKQKSLRRVYTYKATGRVEYDEYYPKKSKHIIDDIDRLLALELGLNDVELDFVLNYEIKYRIGLAGGAGDDAEE
jgi:hypothetical protein